MLNRICIMGRLTAAPELRYTQQNTPVASFTVAVDRDYQQGGSERQTDFITCVAWRRTAEVVADNIYFGESKKRDASPDVPFEEIPDDGELPF